MPPNISILESTRNLCGNQRFSPFKRKETNKRTITTSSSLQHHKSSFPGFEKSRLQHVHVFHHETDICSHRTTIELKGKVGETVPDLRSTSFPPTSLPHPFLTCGVTDFLPFSHFGLLTNALCIGSVLPGRGSCCHGTVLRRLFCTGRVHAPGRGLCRQGLGVLV